MGHTDIVAYALATASLFLLILDTYLRWRHCESPWILSWGSTFRLCCHFILLLTSLVLETKGHPALTNILRSTTLGWTLSVEVCTFAGR